MATRDFIIAAIPGITELVDAKDSVLGYGFGDGYTDLICTIILSKNGVKLGIVGSAAFPDPDGLLEGKGKRHRYVVIDKAADLKRPGVKALLERGVAEWKKKSAKV